MSSARLHKGTKSISITSGKGGVGKTTLTSNIAYALAMKGNRVLIFDGDLGMANVDLMFGVKAQGHIYDVLTGEKTLQQIVTPVAPNISLISGGSGVVELSRLNAFERRALMDEVSSLEYKFDFLLIDTAPGITDNVLFLNSAAQTTAVVVTPDPASFADSYALIKILNRDYKETKFSIICNQVRDEAEGVSLFNRFAEVVNRFLYVGLDYQGSISNDQVLKRSTQQQRLIMKHEPQCEAYRQISQIAQKLERSMSVSSEKSGMQFFWGQVMGVA